MFNPNDVDVKTKLTKFYHAIVNDNLLKLISFLVYDFNFTVVTAGTKVLK